MRALRLCLLPPGPSTPDAEYDVAMATTWQATAHVFDVNATRFAMLVDEFAHHRLTRWQPDRIAAALAYDLPLDFVCRGQWLTDHLADLRPDARTFVVEDGIDKSVFNADGREERPAGAPPPPPGGGPRRRPPPPPPPPP